MPFHDAKSGTIYLNATEVSERWEITPSTMTRYLKKGKLRSKRVGRTVWILADDLIAYEKKIIEELEHKLNLLKKPIPGYKE